jgi:hypothetical protein
MFYTLSAFFIPEFSIIGGFYFLELTVPTNSRHHRRTVESPTPWRRPPPPGFGHLLMADAG